MSGRGAGFHVERQQQISFARRHFASLLIIPVLFVAFYALRALADRSVIEQWLPEWDTFVILGAMMVVERIYTYRYAVSQRPVLARDIASTLVNVYLTYAVTAFILLPGLLLLTELLFGRRLMVASPEQLGPVWLQVPVDPARRQLLPLLDAPLAALERVSVEAAFLSPPRDGSEGDEHLRLAPDRLRAA